MGELTKDTPKPLLRDAGTGKTLLNLILEELPDRINQVIIVIGYKGDQIRKQIGNKFLGKKIIYVEQQKLNGTAGALHAAKEKLNGSFIVLPGDDLFVKPDLDKLIDSKYPVAILVYRISDYMLKKKHGVAEVKGDKVVNITENQKVKEGMWVNTAAYKLNSEFFNYPLVKAGNNSEEFGLPQTIMGMKKDVGAVEAGAWLKVDDPEDVD